MLKSKPLFNDSRGTNRISSGVIGVHLRAELGVKLGAFVDGSRRRPMPYDGTNVERNGAHVNQHTRDVD